MDTPGLRHPYPSVGPRRVVATAVEIINNGVVGMVILATVWRWLGMISIGKLCCDKCLGGVALSIWWRMPQYLGEECDYYATTNVRMMHILLYSVTLSHLGPCISAGGPFVCPNACKGRYNSWMTFLPALCISTNYPLVSFLFKYGADSFINKTVEHRFLNILYRLMKHSSTHPPWPHAVKCHLPHTRRPGEDRKESKDNFISPI